MAPATDPRAAMIELNPPFCAGFTDGADAARCWLTGPTGTLVVEAQDDALGLRPPSTPATVILMRVLAAGVDPAFATRTATTSPGACEAAPAVRSGSC